MVDKAKRIFIEHDRTASGPTNCTILQGFSLQQHFIPFYFCSTNGTSSTWGRKRIAMELKLVSLYALKTLWENRAYKLYCAVQASLRTF